MFAAAEDLVPCVHGLEASPCGVIETASVKVDAPPSGDDAVHPIARNGSTPRRAIGVLPHENLHEVDELLGSVVVGVCALLDEDVQDAALPSKARYRCPFLIGHVAREHGRRNLSSIGGP